MIALSFDNLGEAADLERDAWPAGAPLGRHPSVTEVLPRLLDRLDALGLRATFCVEALNCEMYPEAVAEIAARGHELGLHGWRHETWSELDPGREAELLARGRHAFATLGLDVRGFRPPGGELNAGSTALLREHGFTWISPSGDVPEVVDGLASVPFAWRAVDAYWRMDAFAPQREALGDRPAARTPAETADQLLSELDGGGTLILHPFLMEGDEPFAAASRVLGAVAGRTATVGELAAALTG
jgi:peptidoglycan/xylan/chitin deacetylase (PgdA/CDA1 family)